MMPEALRQGRCVTHPQPDLWTPHSPPELEAAIRICHSCPDMAPCRSWALSMPAASDTATVLGGMGPEERAAIRRARRRSAA